MTRDDINKIIFDNELFHGVLTGMGVVMDIEHLEKFAELVSAAEREACAKVCEDASKPHDGEMHSDSQWAGLVLATTIRARGQE
jgi:hypothetical protein